MEITLIRHLPTEWNRSHVLQGRRDIPLSPITEDEQKKIASNLEQLKGPFDFILCSTLRRTQQTAKLYGYTPIVEVLLDELDFGPFEGKPKTELLNAYGKKWLDSPKDLMLGESLSSFEKRIVSFLEKYKSAENVLVFGHGSWMRAMKSYYKYGHINNMNKTSVKNNECFTLEFLTVEV